jgi:hypothetical protein
MLTTTAFAACFQFVVWTVSVFTTYPYSLYTFPIRLLGLARDYHAANSTGFPEFE